MKHLMTKSLLVALAVSTIGTASYVSAESHIRVNAGISSIISQCLSAERVSIGKGLPVLTKSGQEGTKTNDFETTEEKICGYKNLGITTVENSLNIRKRPNTESSIVGKLPKNAGCEVLETKEDWIKIESGSVTGWVTAEYMLIEEAARERALKVANEIATVTTETLFVREEPNTNASIVSMVPQGEELEVIHRKNDWVKINLDNDKGYVSAEYVQISRKLPKASSITELKYGEGVSDASVSLVSYALQFVGNPYVWGGTSLTNGIDCSGFTVQVYAHYGISLPHYSGAQANYGTRVSASDAQAGDLFFYGNGAGISHVAIYMGSGQIVHASSPSTGIKISNAFYRTPICVVRLLNN
ncbi:MAG: SH3 domain-containing protein [Lachnospiraceae bacterium]